MLAGWARVGIVLAGLLMIFPALVRRAAADMSPHPHLLGSGLRVVLLLRQRPARAGR